MKNYFILLFVVFSCSFALSQAQPNILKSAEKKTEITEQDYLAAIAIFDSETHKVPKDLENAMNTAMMYLMRNRDIQGQMNLYDKAAQYAKRLDQWTEYIDLKSNKAQMLISMGQPMAGIELLDSLIASNEVSSDLLGRLYKAKGDAYEDLNNLNDSEENYLQGLLLAQQRKDTFQIGISYISLASLHFKLGNVYDAIDYNIKGLNILEQGDNAYLVTGACRVLCNIFQELGNYEKAQEYAEKMDQLCKMKGYKQLGAVASAALGRQSKQKGDYDKAIEYFNLALDEYGRTQVRINAAHDKRSEFNIRTDMVEIFLKKAEYIKAKELISEMEEIDLSSYSDHAKMGFNQIQIDLAIAERNTKKIRRHLSMADDLITHDSSFKLQKRHAFLKKKVAEYFGKHKEANVHLTTFFALKDSIEKDQKSQLVHNLEAKYKKAEQEKEITKLSFENEKAESNIKQKNIVLILGGIGLAILSILAFQFYKLYQSNRKNKEQLASQNVIVTKALEDKNTLLKEIHHRVKNNLQVISSLLSLQSRYIKDEDTLDAIKAGKSRVQSMSLLHQNLYRDDNLKGVEMNQYFENLGQNLFDTYNIEENIKFTTDIDDITLDIDTVVPMGLITNELISNALKHAFKGQDSGTIHLSLKEKENALFLTVKDDGVGLPDGELPVSHKSLGATLIQSFTEKLEGDIKIDISDGTMVTVEIKDYALV